MCIRDSVFFMQKEDERMKKRLLSLALAFVLAFSLLPATAFAAEEPKPQGKGTADEPYLIGTAAELEWFRKLVNNSNDTDNHRDACAKLTADIDLKGVEWEPIGGNNGCLLYTSTARASLT